MFPSTCYSQRRKALLQGLASRGLTEGLVLFPGNGESPINYADNCHPFRQDSSFLYFFGIPKPGLAGTIDLATGSTLLYGDDLTMDDIVWTGPEPRIAELAALADIGDSRPAAALGPDIATAHGSGQKIHYLPPYREDTRVLLSALLSRPRESIQEGASLDLVRAVIACREIKEEAEIAELEAAVATTVAMHRAALALARPGMREAEVAARVTELALAAGGGLSFPVIATVRGAVLHNHGHQARLGPGDLFLLDAGAEAPSGYAGDLTTTFPVSPGFDARQASIYEIVLAMGKAATAILRPGLPFEAAHDAAAKACIEGLKGLGLMRGDTEEALAAGAHALFFPHGLGHMIGLDVHDMEALGEAWVGYDGRPRSSQFGRKSLRLAKPLAAGMVHSVEPGIYFIPELFAAWKAEGRNAAFIDFGRVEGYIGLGGIRNEEDWLVTPGGARRLGPAFDKSIAAIEAARKP